MSVFPLQPETVDEKLFLTAVIENKMAVVEKYLSDGGNPNVFDDVSVTVTAVVATPSSKK